MTKPQAEQILRFCQQNGLPKPQRYPITGRQEQYLVRFSSNRMRGQYQSYKGAMNFCLSILEEKDSSGWGL